MPVFTDEGMHASPMDDWSKEVERMRSTRNLGQVIRKYTEELSEKVPRRLRPERRGGAFQRGDGQDPRAHRSRHQVPPAPGRLYLREQLSRYLREGKTG